jgi:REP element-mobilizing transposase RayT
VESDFSVGANSFALKIRHGFKENSLEASSNFCPVETVISSIMDNEVHIVRMNSHLHLSKSLFTQKGYTQMNLASIEEKIIIFRISPTDNAAKNFFWKAIVK